MNMSRVASVLIIVLVGLSASVGADCNQTRLDDCDAKKPDFKDLQSGFKDLQQPNSFCSKAREFANCVSALNCSCSSGNELYTEYLAQVGLVNSNEYMCSNITDEDVGSVIGCLLFTRKAEIEACLNVSHKLDSIVDGCSVYETSVKCVRENVTLCPGNAPADKVSTLFAKTSHPLASAVFGCTLDPGYKETDLPSIDENCIRRNATRTANMTSEDEMRETSTPSNTTTTIHTIHTTTRTTDASVLYNSSAADVTTSTTPSTTTTTAVASVMYNSCWNPVVVFLAYVSVMLMYRQ